MDKYVGSLLKISPIERREIDWTNGLTFLSTGGVTGVSQSSTLDQAGD